MFQNLFETVGDWEKVYTLVDFFQYVKGIEYLICLAFFIGFPMYFKYLKRPEELGK